MDRSREPVYHLKEPCDVLLTRPRVRKRSKLWMERGKHAELLDSMLLHLVRHVLKQKLDLHGSATPCVWGKWLEWKLTHTGRL